jgi:flagellar hook-associated protein 1 FlgK
MGGLFSLLSIARDGVLAQTAALDVTAQNVAGTNTPGFVRRTPVLQSVASGGVEMSGATRTFDRFTYGQLVDQSGRLGAATSRAGAMRDVEALVTPTADHLGDRSDAFFDSLHELALHPSDPAVRSSVISQAQWLASGFSETANGLERSRAELFSRASDLTSEVSERLSQMESIDRDIIDATGRGEGAADLRDRRDQLVKEIGERVGARAVEGPNGGITLFGAGTVLYEGGRAASLGASLDADGGLRIEASRNGNVIDVTKGLQTGTLAGVREARDVDIPRVLAGLDAFASDLTKTINDVHVTGFGLDGVSGRPLFTTSAMVAGAAHAMAVDPGLVAHPEWLAVAGSSSDLPGGNDIAVALANVSRAVLGTGGTASERYALIASNVGVLRTATESEQTMREDTVATASALRESASGVSTDEEMIHLQQYQRAFEASTRVLRAVDELFDSLMQAL